jgi:hypothetical protein
VCVNSTIQFDSFCTLDDIFDWTAYLLGDAEEEVLGIPHSGPSYVSLHVQTMYEHCTCMYMFANTRRSNHSMMPKARGPCSFGRTLGMDIFFTHKFISIYTCTVAAQIF